MRGKFISIEGSEGAGKSTVLEAVVTLLQTQGKEVLVTREPGGTEIGEHVRGILLNQAHTAMHADTELLLMFAARAQHWHQKIQPGLDAGQWVVSDRFVDSSFAYQGGGRQMPLERIEALAGWTLENKLPDLTLLLDLDPEVGMARAKGRGELDRFEQEQLDFFHRVRTVFLQRAQAEPKRFVVIDAAQDAETVNQQVATVLKAYDD